MSSAKTYPLTESHRIVTSTAGAPRTEPPPRGLLRSTMRHREMDDLDFDQGNMMYDQPEKKATQEEQDAEDEKKRKRAMRNLINSWQERLQLISVITTFFATTEAAMLVNTKPGIDDLDNKILRAANAGFLGSLIFHVYASILSFLGAFLLISYKLKQARRDEMIVGGTTIVTSPRRGSVTNDLERGGIELGLPRTHTGNDARSTMQNNKATSTPEQNDRPRDSLYSVAEPPIFAADPHIEQVLPFGSHASSSRLLSRIHAVCVFLAALGFVLAIIGIVCYTWAMMPASVGIFTSACFGGALLSMFFLFV